MKTRMKLLVAIPLIISLAIPGMMVAAQSSTSQTWTSEIVYFNTSDGSGSLSMTFYDETTSYSSSSIAVTGKQSGSLLVGSVGSLPSSFAGSAVLSSDVPIAATYIQFVESPNTDLYSRMIYNGFTADQASDVFYVPTVLKNAFSGDFRSQVGIQNIEDSAASATLEFYAVGDTSPTHSYVTSIGAKESHVFSMDDFSDVDIPDGFSGSLKVTVAEGRRVVASSEETQVTGRAGYAFEGVGGGQNQAYVPTSLCEWNGGNGIFTSYFAIQAIGGAATVDVSHIDRDTGSVVATATGLAISDGSKISVNPCAHGAGAGFIGSSTIESTGAPVVVIAKVVAQAGSGSGTRTAFIAEGTGDTALALPLVRYNDDPEADFRSFIAVMNIDSSAAQNIVATYYNANGTVAATHVLATSGEPLDPMVKINTNAGPGKANAVDGNGDFVGAVVVTSDVNVLVTVRNQINVTGIEVTQFGEDYVGIPIQ